MCKVLKISRSALYYKAKEKAENIKLENSIISEFKASQNNYGARGLKSKMNEGKPRTLLSRISKEGKSLRFMLN